MEYPDRFTQRHAVMLTFDDGYEGVYLNALPVLERYDIPAVVGVITSPQKNPIWSKLAKLVTVDGVDIPTFEGTRLLSYDQMRELQFQHGWRIESHTRQHFPLAQGTVSQINFELESKQDLTEFGCEMLIPPWYSLNSESYFLAKQYFSSIRTVDVWDQYYGSNRAVIHTNLKSMTVISARVQKFLEMLDYAKTHNVLIIIALHNIWTQEEYDRNDPLYYPCPHGGEPCGAVDAKSIIYYHGGWIKDTELELIAQRIVENGLQVVTNVSEL